MKLGDLMLEEMARDYRRSVRLKRIGAITLILVAAAAFKYLIY